VLKSVEQRTKPRSRIAAMIENIEELSVPILEICLFERKVIYVA
jgi:hypothetical protein